MTRAKSKKPRKPAAVVPRDDSLGEKILTEYGSMDLMSGHVKIPKETLRFASKNGCPAFKHHRINTLELFRWFFSQDENGSPIDWGERLTQYQAEREKIKLDKDAKTVADKDEISFSANKSLSQFFAGLDRMIKLELPPELKGLDEMGWRKLLSQRVEAMKSELRSVFQSLAAAETETKPSK